MIEKNGSNLIVQKMPTSGLLSSKQHLVPCNKVFPIKTQRNEKATTASDQYVCPENDVPISDKQEDESLHSDSSDSCDSIYIPEQQPMLELNPASLSNETATGSSSRPVRKRRPLNIMVLLVMMTLFQ